MGKEERNFFSRKGFRAKKKQRRRKVEREF